MSKYVAVRARGWVMNNAILKSILQNVKKPTIYTTLQYNFHPVEATLLENQNASNEMKLSQIFQQQSRSEIS